MDLVSTVFAYISGASPLIPFILGIIHYRTFNSYLKVLFVYICIACCIELISFYLLISKVDNNLFLGQINTVVEFSALIYMYVTTLKIKRPKLLFSVLSFLFTLFVVIDVFYIEGHQSVNALSKNTEAIVLIIFSIVFFYQLMVRAEHATLLMLPAFWINAGVIIYFSGRFFLILFSNYLIENDQVAYLIFFMIHSIFNITFNVLIAVGFHKQKNVR